MHRAAIAGDLAMVEKLVARGADTSNRDNPFNTTPLAWADHGKQQHVVDWLRAHTVVDIHDAVGFGFSEHVEARLQENPALANLAIDQWDIPMGTPLHWAAAMGRAPIASLLLDAGADPTALAGNGVTPVDIAVASGAAVVAELIEARGGQRRATRA
jgi:ankyrin repeat protein